MPTIIRAEVILQIRVECHDVWAPETEMGQVLKQAHDSAKAALNFHAWETRQLGDKLSFVGDPRITVKAVET